MDEIEKLSNLHRIEPFYLNRIKSTLKRLRYALWDSRKLESACKELENGK